MEVGYKRRVKKRARLMSPTAVIAALNVMNEQFMLKKWTRERDEAFDKMTIRSKVPTDKHWPEPIKEGNK